MAAEPPPATSPNRSPPPGHATADAACVAFLQWALPRVGLRWTGFRKVRRQVCRRVARRLTDLRIAGLPEYRRYLDQHPQEWQALAGLCRVTISRFLRDRGVFDYLSDHVLPELAAAALERGHAAVRCWCAGCASGEEVWSLRLIFDLVLAAGFPITGLALVGTDIDLAVLARARRAVYPKNSLRELPASWRATAFEELGGEHLRDRFRHDVVFTQHDLRTGAPGEAIDLVLCRNLAFTYFDEAAQWETGRRLAAVLRSGGVLVLGSHERLPPGLPGLIPLDAPRGLYRSGV